MEAILMDKKKMSGNSVKIRTIWSVKEKRLKMKKKKRNGSRCAIEYIATSRFLFPVNYCNVWPKALSYKKTDTHRFLINQGGRQGIVNVAAFNCRKVWFQEKFSTNQILTGTIGICRRQEVRFWKSRWLYVHTYINKKILLLFVNFWYGSSSIIFNK